MKNCIACHRSLALGAFYKHPQMADGHLNKCKECVIAYQKNRAANPELKAAREKYEKGRAMLPHRVASRKRYQQSPEGKVALRRAHEKQKELFPKKRAARIKVGNAVRDGKLHKPDKCQECNSEGRIHGHHDDYDKPLDVRWLCTTCHRQWHIANGDGANGT
jgi:hypothetical protein